ncbi:MAG: endonuclease/exonuclease/phosphatase family protein [Chloroflexi bacterium]|nr:endonuclease/exonuclease/phosphatase family protein [Chloroflexota bacterium]
MSLRLVNWNVQWATPSPRSRRTPEILRRIDQHGPEVVCLTETHPGLLSPEGYAICSQADYGSGIREDRRKVVLWSMQPWENVDDLGDDSLPPGRFVSGVTRTSLGEVTVVGVCIPWSGSRTGARRAQPMRRWQDHDHYLEGLTKVLGRVSAQRLIVVGDFNQVIGPVGTAGRKRQAALLGAFPASMTIATAAIGYEGRRTIDHIAISADLAAESLGVISHIHGARKLSDHFGVTAALSARPLR